MVWLDRLLRISSATSVREARLQFKRRFAIIFGTNRFEYSVEIFSRISTVLSRS